MRRLTRRTAPWIGRTLTLDDGTPQPVSCVLSRPSWRRPSTYRPAKRSARETGIIGKFPRRPSCLTPAFPHGCPVPVRELPPTAAKMMPKRGRIFLCVVAFNWSPLFRAGGGFPLITQRSLVQIQAPQPTESKQITVVSTFPDSQQYFPLPQDKRKLSPFLSPSDDRPESERSLLATGAPGVWASGFNDTKVPASSDFRRSQPQGFWLC